MDSLNFFSLNVNLYNISGYSLLITIFALLTLLVLFMRNRIKGYLSKRNKLIEMSEDYERRRNCRNDLRVLSKLI